MSNLQAQYPLSPRKFWKKMFGSIIGGAVLFAVLTLMLWLVGATSSDSVAMNLVGTIIFWFFFLIVIYLFLRGWYWRTYIKRYYYDANENFITIKKGVFAPAEIHVQYSKIQDVYVDQDVIDRIMGLYDVHIASATATSAIEAHIDGVEQAAAEGLKTMLLEKIRTGGPAAASVFTAAVSTDAQVQLNEDISTKNYPLSGAWLAQQGITYFFSALFISVVAVFYLFTQDKNGTAAIGSVFGLDPAALGFWFFAIVFGFHIVWALVWRSTYNFQFLPEYIFMHSGVISRSEVHIPYRTIQDVVVSQSIVERMLGIATVKIQNAAQAQVVAGKTVTTSGVNIPGQTLDKANHLSEVVKNIVLTKNPSQTGL